MATNPQARVLELLKRFNNGELVCIDKLQNDTHWIGKSEKTIRRDLDAIRAYFPDSFEVVRGNNGCYRAITEDIFKNFIDKETLSLMVQTFNIAQEKGMLESLNIEDDYKKILSKKIKESKECYHFITKPYETKKGDTALLEVIEKAIYRKNYMSITYKKEEEEEKEYQIKPYKIVLLNENFYLASENIDKKYLFSLFRVIYILKIEVQNKTFRRNLDIEDFILSIQTSFSNYTPQFKNHLITVKIEVSPFKAKFFKLKKSLPSQKIEQENSDGSLVLSFLVTQERELEELVKKWIPHLKVISPLSLKERIDRDLRGYLGKN